MRVVGAIIALAAFGGGWAAAGPAQALEPGVFISPHSPAGKEYSYPLDVQRGAAVGHDAPQGVAQPLFGVGITPAAGAVSTSASTGAATTASRGSRATGSKAAPRRLGPSARSGRAVGRERTNPREATALQQLSRPRGTDLQVALVAVPVILGGLLAGAAVAIARRRRA